MVTALLGQSTSGYDTVRKYWESQLTAGDFERSWRRALHDGVIEGTAFAPKEVSLQNGDWTHLEAGSWNTSDAAGAMELIFRPDPSIWDGRFSNNGWLQELPKQLSKLTIMRPDYRSR